MHAAQTRHKKSNSRYDLYQDFEKIKAALAETTFDMKGKAGEMFSNSVDNLKEKSEMIQENAGEYISERPFKSIAVSLLSGIVIGYLLNRR